MSVTHRQKAARAIMKKTGLSYQQALNCLLESIAEVEAGLPETQHRSRSGMPVVFDRGSLDASGPGVKIVGEPGTGKTFVDPMSPGFLGSLPGGEPVDLSGGMPDSFPDGVRLGLGLSCDSPIGSTVPVAAVPIIFNPYEIIGDGYPPVTAVTGFPGSGKSFFTFMLADRFTRDGVRTILIDPMGDGLPTSRNNGNVTVIDLREANAGALNPFLYANSKSEASLTALTILRTMMGNNLGEEQWGALVAAISEVSDGPSPSLGKVVDFLLAEESSSHRTLGSVLRTVSKVPYADLLFGEGPVLALPEEGTVVLSLLGCELPDAGSNAIDGMYTFENHVAVAVTRSLTSFSFGRLTAGPRDARKALIVRSANVLLGDTDGDRMFQHFARAGRSHNLVTVVEMQSVRNLLYEGVRNSVSTHFFFRTPVDKEADVAAALIGGSPLELEAHASMVKGLRNGETVMLSADGKHVVVQINAM